MRDARSSVGSLDRYPQQGRQQARASGQPIDAHWDSMWRAARPLPRDPGKRRSLYRTMRDGTQLAVDVTLPSSFRTGDKLPTILRQTRYFRSVEMPAALDFRMSRDAFDIVAPTRERFLAHGYAWVDVDVRGSGVSSGAWPGPWSPAEVRDGGEIVDFIIREPWSNGLVGSTGISYEGTTSEMLLVNRHEAVRAVAPRFSLLCAYEDVAFPGGAHLGWFTQGWARYNRLLDDHRVHDALAELVYVIARARSWQPGAIWSGPARALLDRVGPERTKRLIGLVFGVFLRGGRRVDEDLDGSLRSRALLDHVDNGDVHALCLEGCFRDDVAPNREDVAFAAVSPRGHLPTLASSGAAVFSYGGWLDGGYAQAAARRFVSLGKGRLLIGPWGHAGVFAHDPTSTTMPAAFPHEVELFRFFDRELRGREHEDASSAGDSPVRYFTLVKNEWNVASQWPPAHVRPERFHFDASRRLVPKDDARHGSVVVKHDPRFGTGERSRWRGLLAGFVPADYPDFAARLRDQVVFKTDPFAQGVVITGHPVVRLFVSGGPDYTVMAYVVDVGPDGSVRYVTEGQLRALHRAASTPERGYEPLTPYRSFDKADAIAIPSGEIVELVFGLLPTSYWIRPGHRIGVALTLGDNDHFAPIDGAGSVEVHTASSHLDLPFERR